MKMFKDPIAPPARKENKKSSFKSAREGGEFACGDYYGTGFKNPVGKERATSFSQSDVIPKRSKCIHAVQVV